MYPIHSNQQRLQDLLARLGFDDAQPPPPPTPHEFTIGTTNPALAELKRRRGQLNPRQTKLVDDLDEFYDNTNRSQANVELGYFVAPDDLSALRPIDREALQRRASFLLNTDAMNALPQLYVDVCDDEDLAPNAELEINAVFNSAKSHAEHVMAAALQDARAGERVCPLVFQPVDFPVFLTANSFLVRQVVRACCLPQPTRDIALKPALEDLANAYFSYSVNFPGAPKLRPQDVHVNLNSAENTSTSANRRGYITATVGIDSLGAEQFCRSLRADAEVPDNSRDLLRAHLLRGFEGLQPEQKLAAFYIQSLLQELAEVEEVMGVQSVDIPQHGAAAQRAARGTLKEWNYEGSQRLRDEIRSQEEGELSQREEITYSVQLIAEVDDRNYQETGEPFIMMPQVRAWACSPAMLVDLRALREPSARLLLQAPPITGRALLDMPEFKE